VAAPGDPAGRARRKPPHLANQKILRVWLADLASGARPCMRTRAGVDINRIEAAG